MAKATKLIRDEEREQLWAEADSEAHGHGRLLISYQSQESGWKQAAAKLRALSGEAFAHGKDDDARMLRMHAEALEMAPELNVLRDKATDAYKRQIEWEAKAEALKEQP